MATGPGSLRRSLRRSADYPSQRMAHVRERLPTEPVASQLQRAQQLRDLGRIDEAEVVLRALLQSHPHNVDALVAMARIARGRGDRAASLALFQAAAAAAPQRPSMKLQAASDLRELGRLEEAEAVLRAVLADQPQHVETLVALGLLKLARFELDEAERLLSSALAAAPDDAGALVALGRLARRRGDRAQALAHFETARRVNPRHAGALLELAAELRESGRYDEARDAVQRALDLDVGDTRASIQMAYLHRRQGDHARALELLRAAHKRQPQAAAIHVDMAIELRALGDPAAAEAQLNAALALEPGHPGALDQLATHYLLSEDFERSLAWSRQAIAAHPRRLAPICAPAGRWPSSAEATRRWACWRRRAA